MSHDHKKPTTPFGYIAFGKDGSVRRNIRSLPDYKAAQEIEVGDEFINVASYLWKGNVTVSLLAERDHDFRISIDGKPCIEVQCTEIVYRDFLADPDAFSPENVLLGIRKNPHPVDLEKRDNVLAQKIANKLGRHYSKPAHVEFWLLIWSVTGYMGFGKFWQGGASRLPSAVLRARRFVEEHSAGPFDKIFFFDMQSRPTLVWPPEGG